MASFAGHAFFTTYGLASQGIEEDLVHGALEADMYGAYRPVFDSPDGDVVVFEDVIDP